MKILHISGARSWGGNEQQLVEMIPVLNKYNIVNYVFGVNFSPLSEYCNKHNINFIACKKNKLNTVINYKFLLRTVQEFKPDVIHLHTSDSVTLYVVSDLLYNLKTPTVFSKKGVGSKVSVLSKIKYNYKNIHKIICVSEIVKAHFKEVLSFKNHHKLCIVYDGVKKASLDIKAEINLFEKCELEENVKIIGNIANHTQAKDLVTFVKTLHILVNKKKVKNIHFIQIGSFSKKTKELKQLVEEYKLKDFISFLGFTENASLLIPQFDVFLMTSVREGGPTSVLEAFSKKVSVVSTKVGVVIEAVNDGENGFLAAIGNANQLADKVETLINNDELQKEFSEKSYQLYLQLFTIESLGINTLKIYKEVLGK